MNRTVGPFAQVKATMTPFVDPWAKYPPMVELHPVTLLASATALKAAGYAPQAKN